MYPRTRSKCLGVQTQTHEHPELTCGVASTTAVFIVCFLSRTRTVYVPSGVLVLAEVETAGTGSVAPAGVGFVPFSITYENSTRVYVVERDSSAKMPGRKLVGVGARWQTRTSGKNVGGKRTTSIPSILVFQRCTSTSFCPMMDA